MKKRLGRGWAAIIPTDLQEIRKSPYTQIPIYRLDPNPNIASAPIGCKQTEELAERLTNTEITTPIAVQKMASGQLIVISGERRWRAAMLTEIESLPAVIRGPNGEDPLFKAALIENLKSEELDPVDWASTSYRLITEYGYTHAQIGEEIGKDRATVSNFIRLLKLPSPIQVDLRAGLLSPGHSKALLSLKTTEEQLILSEKIKTQKLSVRRVESEVKSILNQKKGTTQHPKEALSQTLGAKVKIQRTKGGRGQIVISFQSDADLARLCDKICDVKISKT